MTTSTGEPEWGSALYALTHPTCNEHLSATDWLSFVWFLPRYVVLLVAYHILPWRWLLPRLDPRTDPRPFMCPVCFWSGTMDRLLPGVADEDGHSDEAVCPRCEC